MTITIEDATTKDLDRLYEIELECFRSEAFTRQQIASLLADYNCIGLVAKVNDKIVGFIIGMIYLERKAPIGHILTIDVLPSYRRKGIGISLLQEIEAIFREKNVGICSLEAREDNLSALQLYQKCGYVKVGKLKNYYKNAHGIYFRKVLT